MKEENYLFNESEIPVIKEGIRLFNDEMYWECHEELEHHWIELNPNPVRYVYWAVLQVAVCLYHVREENILGAQGLLKKAKEKWITLFERDYILTALKRSRYNISHAAREAEIDRKYFRKLMHKYGIEVP